MEVTDKELRYLAIVYTDYSISWLFLDNESLQEDLRCRGFLEVDILQQPFSGVVGERTRVHYRITEEGKQLLSEMPAGRVVHLCFDNIPVVQAFAPRLALEELPEFLAHNHYRVREAVQERYKQLCKRKKLPSLIWEGVRSWMGGK